MLTKQEIFDIVWNGAKKQEFRLSRDFYGCCYRSRSEAGVELKCNAGHLIPDEFITTGTNNTDFDTILEKYQELKDKYSYHQEFISDMQYLHDSSEDALEHKQRLIKFAELEKLKIPEGKKSILNIFKEHRTFQEAVNFKADYLDTWPSWAYSTSLEIKEEEHPNNNSSLSTFKIWVVRGWRYDE